MTNLIEDACFHRFRQHANKEVKRLTGGAASIEDLGDTVDPYNFFDADMKTDPELREAAVEYAVELLDDAGSPTD